jgi:hypothetical protein
MWWVDFFLLLLRLSLSLALNFNALCIICLVVSIFGFVKIRVLWEYLTSFLRFGKFLATIFKINFLFQYLSLLLLEFS